MFYLSKIEHTLRLPPHLLRLPLNEAIKLELENVFLDKVIANLGLCISIYDIKEIEGGFVYPGEGASTHTVKFRLMVFRPFLGEIIAAKLKESDANGLRLSLGFFEDIYIPSHLLPSPSRSEPDPNGRYEVKWIWEFGDTKYVIDGLDEIKFRVLSVNYPSIPIEQAEGSKPFAPMVINGSIDYDGLGPVSWCNIIVDAQICSPFDRPDSFTNACVIYCCLFTEIGIVLLSLNRPALTKNGSETPVVLPAPSWGSHCCVVANVGSYVSFNGSGKGAAATILWDRVPAFLGMSVGSVYPSGQYISLVVFISGRLMIAPVFCSYHFGWSDPCRGGNSSMADLIEDPHIVDVDGKLFSARHILISVGERPFIRDISGSEYAIDSDAALDLPSKPEKIAICWWWIHCLGISWHLQWSKK
ncbi:F4H5.12 protein [Citrus sinensis]|nr:F4H5.12 protein [Citrus sinensis]